MQTLTRMSRFTFNGVPFYLGRQSVWFRVDLGYGRSVPWKHLFADPGRSSCGIRRALPQEQGDHQDCKDLHKHTGHCARIDHSQQYCGQKRYGSLYTERKIIECSFSLSKRSARCATSFCTTLSRAESSCINMTGPGLYLGSGTELRSETYNFKSHLRGLCFHFKF